MDGLQCQIRTLTLSFCLHDILERSFFTRRAEFDFGRKSG